MFSFWVGLTLPWFTCFVAGPLGCLLGLFCDISSVYSRFLFSFLGMPFLLLPWRQRRRRHKRIRGVGSQIASRRGAKPRLSAPVFKARPLRFGSFCGAFANRYVPMTSRPRPTFLAAAIICMILVLFVGLRLEQAPCDTRGSSLLRPLSHTIPFQEMLGVLLVASPCAFLSVFLFLSLSLPAAFPVLGVVWIAVAVSLASAISFPTLHPFLCDIGSVGDLMADQPQRYPSW